jgi:hypothetical protein
MKDISPFEGEKLFFFSDLGNGKFHPWDGSQDDMMTPEQGRRMRSLTGDSIESLARHSSSSPPTFTGHNSQFVALGTKPALGSSKKVLYDDWPRPPLKPGELYAGSLFSKDHEPFCHKYEQDVWDESPQP